MNPTLLIVLGSFAARREHVERSLREPGCLHHSVALDPADPKRLVFVERWASAEDLMRHFRVPESIAFARALGALAAVPPEIKVYEAREVPLPLQTKPQGDR